MSANFEQFLNASRQYNTIPVFERFFVDTMTPIQIFQKLHHHACFILESNDSTSPWANFSFIGLDPFIVLKEENGQFVSRTRNGSVIAEHERFRNALLQTIASLKPMPIHMQIPFTGGAVGYISYDGITEFDKTFKPHPHHDITLPRFHFSFCETIIAYDHKLKEITIITHIFIQHKKNRQHLKKLYDNAMKKIREIVKHLLSAEQEASPIFQLPHATNDVNFNDIQSNFTKEAFLKSVKKIKQHIQKGEILQAVISQRFERKIAVDGLEIYRALRVINPSPYLFFLKIDDFEVVGSSPEKLIQVNKNQPIAGTRRRGKTNEEDKKLAEELLQDEKERSEHLMLVDLAKKEIAQVAKQNTVAVQSLMKIGYFSHVMHMISKVAGTLADHCDPIDALIAAFPAGTLTGAPKRRAMEMIYDVEPTARNLYGGAIGYIGFDGNIDSCIAIRTILIKNQTAYVQAGAGIVANSVPENEWEETRNKAKALIQSIAVAEQLFNAEGVSHHV